MVGGGYSRTTMIWWEGAIHALQRCGGRGLYTDYNDVVGGGYTRTTMMWWEGLYTDNNDVVGGE